MNLVWLRNDLRLEDNPALYHSSQQGPICCVFTLTATQWQQHDDAPAKIAFWKARLQALSDELAVRNIPIKLLNAEDYQQIPTQLLALANTIGASTLHFNHEYPLNEKQRDQQVTALFEQHDIAVHRYHGDVVHPPGTVKTQNNGIYHVFTPFARQWRKQVDESLLQVLPSPKAQAPTSLASSKIDQEWPLSSQYREDLWPPTTAAIHSNLGQFTESKVVDYKELRDFPNIAGTSLISPYLMCGALSVRQCIQATRTSSPDWLNSAWTNELIWREFYRHLTDSYPRLSRSENFKPIQRAIPWENAPAHWQAWSTGTTGFPIVDAAIKQLLQTGWMHNRLRMVTAAFLTKLLLIDWRKGEQFFMEHLIDGDYASNNGGWQWAASTGADAAPYFRIFNPQRQSERYDPEGQFIKRFLPELKALDAKSIHQPSSQQRRQCAYPEPIIDYRFARQRALDSYASAMGKK